MSIQAEGFVGRIVAGMIRRSVKNRLRNLYWSPPAQPVQGPVIFYANHHGWLDGYLMFHLVEKLKVRCLDWIEEFDTFPLFSKIGGMRYAPGDDAGRAATIRKTIRLMNEEKRSLVLFAEGVLHRPPQIWPLGKALALVAKKVAGVRLIPTAIYYEHSLHERPEAWISMGQQHEFVSLEDCHSRLSNELSTLKNKVEAGEEFEVLAAGTKDVNERMSMRRLQKR